MDWLVSEKDELVGLCVSHVNSTAYRRRGARGGAFSGLKGLTNNINDFLNSAFDMRAPPRDPPRDPPPARSEILLLFSLFVTSQLLYKYSMQHSFIIFDYTKWLKRKKESKWIIICYVTITTELKHTGTKVKFYQIGKIMLFLK